MSLAISPWDVFDALGWNPHKAQESVIESSARNRVIAAGRRSGKSNIGGYELVPECLMTKTQESLLLEQGKRREFWLVGPTYQDPEKEFRVLWNALKKLKVPFDSPGSYYNPVLGSMHLSCWKGTFQVHGKSAMHPESLVGEGLHGVVMCEAAKMKPVVWTRFIRPMLADYHGWSIHSSTPEGKDEYFYQAWKAGQDPNNTDWASWRYPSWVNPHVYKTETNSQDVKKLLELMDSTHGANAKQIAKARCLKIDDEILSLIQDLSTEEFNQEIGAMFTEFTGRVFKAFSEETHVFDLEYNPQWLTVAFLDTGFTAPSCWLWVQIGPWGQIHILDEIYKAELTTPELAREIQQAGLDKNVKMFYPDPAAAGDNRELEDLLKISSARGTGGELIDRIKLIRRALKQTPQEKPTGGYTPQLKINRKCVHTISDMLNYRYPKKRDGSPSPEIPEKKNDHAPEAIGRGLIVLFGDKLGQSTKQSKANIGR